MQNLSGFSILQPNRHPCHECIHDDEVAEAPAHHEQVENLMGTEVLMLELNSGSFNA